MVEGFLGGLNRQLIFWSGWVFTVGGAAVSFGVGGYAAWIGALCVVTGLLALMSFAYQKYQDLLQAQQTHEARGQQHEVDLRGALERADVAERKLQEAPNEIVCQLKAMIEGSSFEQLAVALAGYAGYVRRMIAFQHAHSQPLTIKVFVKRADGLYANTKLSADAMAHLRQDDRFLMQFRNQNGLATRSAALRVHELDPVKEIVWLQVTDYTGNEMRDIESLADKQEVQAKGYSARPECDWTLYAALNLTDVEAAIRILTAETLRLRGKRIP